MQPRTINSLVLSALATAHVYAAPAVSTYTEVSREFNEQMHSLLRPSTVVDIHLSKDLDVLAKKLHVQIEEHILTEVKTGPLNPDIYCIDEGLPVEGDFQIAGAGILHTTSVGFHADEQYTKVFDAITKALEKHQPTKIIGDHVLEQEYTVPHYKIDPHFAQTLGKAIKKHHLRAFVAHGDCGAAKLALTNTIVAIINDYLGKSGMSHTLDVQSTAESIVANLPEEIIDHHALEFTEDMAEDFNIKADFIPMNEHPAAEQERAMQRNIHKHHAHGIVVASDFSLNTNLSVLEQADVIGGEAFHLTFNDYATEAETITEHANNIIIAILIQIGQKPLPNGEKFSILFVRKAGAVGPDNDKIASIISRIATDPRIEEKKKDIVFQIVDIPGNN